MGDAESSRGFPVIHKLKNSINRHQVNIGFDEVDEDDQILGDDGDDPKERAIITLKLDSITLPYFDSKLSDWVAFKDMFVYLVHKSAKLSDTLKFHQLRNHLRGVALDTIKGYQPIGKNYESAWADLVKRYDRKDELVEEYSEILRSSSN